MNQGSPIVQLRNVSKIYQLPNEKVTALSNLSLEVKSGEFIAITGESGSGKSTLLQLIGGLDKPTGGTITVNGNNLSTLNDNQLSDFRRSTIGFVFQSFYLQPFLTVQQNIELPTMPDKLPIAERHHRSELLAEQIELADLLKRQPNQLSGGQIQRVAIARALVNRPPIILADEPTGNLDSKNSELVVNLLIKMQQLCKATLIIVTHNSHIAKLANRIITLHDGKIGNAS